VDTPKRNGMDSTDLDARLDNLGRGHPSGPDHSRPTWVQAKAEFVEAWRHHEKSWPRAEQKPERAELGTAVDRELADGCDKIQAVADDITTRLRAIEGQQPARTLAGLEFCLKGRERVIEKATEYMREMPGFTPTQALAMVPDPVRYTFRYEDHDYCAGIRLDIDRLKASGFEMIKLKNYWTDPDYHGVNTQWRDTATSQRFEVQFHTAISFEAKQLTHGAYERLRTGDISDEEDLELEHFQREVTAAIPCPPGATDIPEHG
jgi:hypothetical protein